MGTRPGGERDWEGAPRPRDRKCLSGACGDGAGQRRGGGGALARGPGSGLELQGELASHREGGVGCAGQLSEVAASAGPARAPVPVGGRKRSWGERPFRAARGEIA